MKLFNYENKFHDNITFNICFDICVYKLRKIIHELIQIA